MKYSREQRAKMREQQPLAAVTPSEEIESTDPIFFWREFEEPYGILCQWYLSKFQDVDVHPTHVFNCAEQYMMYQKALLIAAPDPNTAGTAVKEKAKQGSQDTRQDDAVSLPGKVLADRKPGRQKALARSVPFSVAQEKEWERIKFDVVVQGSWCKYSQNADLRTRLLATGDRELVEASPQDTVWGIGFRAEWAEVNRAQWGSNLLGKALMSVRERLKAEQAAHAEQG